MMPKRDTQRKTALEKIVASGKFDNKGSVAGWFRTEKDADPVKEKAYGGMNGAEQEAYKLEWSQLKLEAFVEKYQVKRVY